jgi:N,N'-diacetyllegionaminate synthase
MVEIVAEIGINHNGNMHTAKDLIWAAVDSGATTCKFQVFSPALSFDGDEQLLETLQRTQLDPGQLEVLRAECHKVGVGFLCSAFDRPAIDLLVAMGEQRVKVPSSRNTIVAYLEYLARQPFSHILFAMGDCEPVDTQRARNIFRNHYYTEVECISAYPCDPRRFVFPDGYARWGFSDHSDSWEACVAAVARGARYIEKHFTLYYNQEGPDHAASLIPAAFAEMVKEIRTVETILANTRKCRLLEELGTARRKSSHDVTQYRG